MPPVKRERSPSPLAHALPLERLYPSAGPQPKPPKKIKGEDGQPIPQPIIEKRLKLYKKTCPKATQERVDRVMSQRFFCIGRERTSELSEDFKVLGSTGNVYTIRICNVSTCDCPDGQKGNHCKHILFVYLKILQVPHSVNLWYQSALLTTELRAIFANARPAPQDQLAERVKKMYKLATGKDQGIAKEGEFEVEEEEEEVVKKRIPQEGDSCPICYEDFEPNSTTGLVFCLSIQGCGNALHAPCFSQWERTSRPVTCPLCREKWHSPTATNAGSNQAGPSVSSEGYLNFAAQAGISGHRDTSTYYNGPRRGEKYRGGAYGYDGGRYGGSYGRYGGGGARYEDDEFEEEDFY
ncbi:hypothetical protein JCM5353_005186 [Sporobolomyces roseus]